VFFEEVTVEAADGNAFVDICGMYRGSDMWEEIG
jgi:hypothetical protein